MSVLDVLTDIKNLVKPPTIETIGIYQPVAAAGDYAAEDVISNHATAGRAWKFDGVVRKKGGSGRIVQALAMWETTALTPRWTLYLFRGVPEGVLNDNVANTSPTIADWINYIGKLDFSALEDLGGISESFITLSTVGNLPVYFTCAGGVRDIYGVIVTRDAVTGEAANSRAAIVLTTEQF